MLKKILAIAIAIISALLLVACASGASNAVDEIALGDGLPTFELSKALTKAAVPNDADEGLQAVYTNVDADVPDVWVYSFGKADGQTLESFGQDWAAEHKVFCNMISYDDCPCANVTYYRNVDDEDRIIRSYIFESDESFRVICFLYKTEETGLGESGKLVSLMSGFREDTVYDGVFPYEREYKYEDEYLPMIRVREFGKNYFTADTYNSELMPDTTQEEYSAWAQNGWTLEEAIEFYADNYELLKGEIIERNGLDAAFIGYIDGDVFYVRALIDCGDEYVMLCAENDAALFQHVVNALIDTID